MRLLEIDGKLVRLGPGLNGGRVLEDVAHVRDADGVMFLCPGCYRKNEGPIGTHSVLIWIAERVPDDEEPRSRWRAEGSDARDLTLTPSVNVLPDQNRGPKACPGWHGWIRDGVICDA